MQADSIVPTHTIQPFPYHKKLYQHFRERRKTWDWFSMETTKKLQVDQFKEKLLKNTYRFSEASHPEVFAISKEVCAILNIDAVPYFYQENNSIELNASIVVIEREAHIVFSGNILNLLSEKQLKALIAHELSHYLFFQLDGGHYEVTQRIALALANDPQSEPAVRETARIFQLYLELFCDQGALLACGNASDPIETLVKLNTGLTTVNAASYLEQAREIINKDYETTNQSTHPETYIRSISLDLWHHKNPDYFKELEILIEGKWDINSVDIFEQKETRDLTKALLQLLLKPRWFQTERTINLAQQFFPEFIFYDSGEFLKSLQDKLEQTTPSTKSYLSYILLDFARVDQDLELLPLAHTLELAELLGLIQDYERTVRKELNLTITDFKETREKAVKSLASITQNQNDSIYGNE